MPSLESGGFHKDRVPRENGYKKEALRCYMRGLGDLNMEQGEEYIQTTKTIASLLHEREDFEEAKKHFDAFALQGDCVSSDEINLFLELC